MPFLSKRQQRFMYANKPKGVDLKEWASKTDFTKLPERVRKKRKKSKKDKNDVFQGPNSLEAHGLKALRMAAVFEREVKRASDEEWDEFEGMEESEIKERKLTNRLLEVLREIDKGVQGSISGPDSNLRWISVEYSPPGDDEGYADIRVFLDPDSSLEDPSFVINVNVGPALYSIPLKEFLEKKGFRVSRLQAYMANPKERELLEQFSKRSSENTVEIQ
jgi:hypothetical protein